MTNRAPLKIIANLEKALGFAKMGHGTTFGMPYDKVCVHGPGYDSELVTKNEYIKTETRIWRETWLIPQIEEALAWARGES